MVTAQQGKLSAAEKKTIEFGLAVAILTSGPWAGECASKRSSGTSGDPSSEQRASKQLRLWQGACLGGLAQVGSETRPHPATTRDDDRGIALAGGRRDNTSHGIGSAFPAELPNARRSQRGDLFPVTSGRSGSAAAVEPVGRLPTSGASSNLRALGAVALSGCRSDGARAVQKEALEGIWHGDCSPSTVSLFVREMLEQVVLCGQGVGSGQTYRHVLDLMVSIVEDVAETASVVAAANANAKTGPLQPQNWSDNDAASISRRIDVALAVSQAFDTTLVLLARGLRGGGICSVTGTQGLQGNTTSGGSSHGGLSASAFTRRQRRRAMVAQPQSREATALAQAGRAGLFLDAYESVVAGLGNAFSHLALAEQSFGHDDGGDGGADSLPPNGSPTGDRRSSPDEPLLFTHLTGGQHLGTPNRPKTTVPERNMPAKHGLGWDAEARRNAWTQTKLEVLAEATTLLSSFPMGQLRLQRVVSCVYEWARLA
ncbi:unnamed protein product [Ectocarpus sp. 12 AP-2014]